MRAEDEVDKSNKHLEEIKALLAQNNTKLIGIVVNLLERVIKDQTKMFDSLDAIKREVDERHVWHSNTCPMCLGTSTWYSQKIAQGHAIAPDIPPSYQSAASTPMAQPSPATSSKTRSNAQSDPRKPGMGRGIRPRRTRGK